MRWAGQLVLVPQRSYSWKTPELGLRLGKHIPLKLKSERQGQMDREKEGGREGGERDREKWRDGGKVKQEACEEKLTVLTSSPGSSQMEIRC